jgi:hypothetical protein
MAPRVRAAEPRGTSTNAAADNPPRSRPSTLSIGDRVRADVRKRAARPRIRGQLIKIDAAGHWVTSRDGERVPDEEYYVAGVVSGRAEHQGESWATEVLYLTNQAGAEYTYSASGYYARKRVVTLGDLCEPILERGERAGVRLGAVRQGARTPGIKPFWVPSFIGPRARGGGR